MNIPTDAEHSNGSEIAIIGLSGRFPGAKNVDEFWNNLQNGIESISFFSDEELLAAGVDAALIGNPNYVKRNAVIEDAELFDAEFFGFNPRDAEITDPQHRIFLECAWEALEKAGYNSETYKGSIGVFAGSNFSGYLLNIYFNQNIRNSVDEQQIAIAGDKDYLATRTSYKLNLTGPSYTVQTACSTSLVAVHLACQSLLNGECDIALVGGVSISASRKAGYLYNQGGINSPDGHCRAFDAKAGGTVGGEGVGIVVLKRLEDALTDRDSIDAVIKGSAINNDGSNKVSYTAPRIEGQAKVIKTAQVVAELDPETITYIEAHGTGTSLGDPIEIAALTQTFRSSTKKKNFCAIGSLKTNIGHLDAAAGVAGLIKTVLALKHKQIPPSLHFEQPNPQIDFANSPFYVNNKLSQWEVNKHPRRAGVSSFGIGGTNAHVILEEAPVFTSKESISRPWQLLVLSAKTQTALESATTNLIDYLAHHPDTNLADVAHTLQVGRRNFNHRRVVLCQDTQDAIKILTAPDQQGVLSNFSETRNHSIVFMFPGQGAQYVNMGRELYETEAIFRQQVDDCSELLKPHLKLDLKDILYPSTVETTQEQLKQTSLTQVALFVIEYALAKLWMAWGIHPQVMIGHSIGEYVAACISGVFSLEDALTLVVIRGRLMQQVEPGSMLSVSLSAKEIQPMLGSELSLAASNAPSLCVVSGATNAIAALQNSLIEQGVDCRLLHTSHAFHSQMMEPILEPFVRQVKDVNLQPPQIPFVSNVTGTWITAEQATDPDYWARHLRQTVLFNEGIAELLQQPRTLLEVGPGRTLTTLAKRQLISPPVVLTSLRHPQEQISDVAFLLNTLSRLWLSGLQINWASFYTKEQRRHIPLPTYPFERQRYWIEANPETVLSKAWQKSLVKKPDIADWFYIPIWKQSTPLEFFQGKELVTEQNTHWLIFIDDYGIGGEVAKRLEQQSQNVVTVRVADKFTKLNKYTYTIDPQQSDDYDALLQELQKESLIPNGLAHFWSITPDDTLSGNKFRKQTPEDYQNLGFWSLLYLTQALGRQNISNSLKLRVVTNNLYNVIGDEILCPEKATILGPCKIIPKEYLNINSCAIDVVIPASNIPPTPKFIDYLITELTTQQTDNIVAYRGSHRWIQTFEAVRLDESTPAKTKLKPRGVYLITGGLGGIGLVLAEYLAKTVQAKLVLIGRKGLPERSQWEQWLETHDSQDNISCKIQKMLLLEELGSEIEIKSADVANYEQMQVAVTEALEKFGQINGVIHAAGIAGGGIVQLKTQDLANSVLAPKVKGTLVLEEIFNLKNINLDFLVLCSSQSSILSEFGQVDYCAANAFLDIYADYCTAKSDRFTVAINWGTWQEVGMAVETALPEQLKHQREEDLKKGILSQEGAEAFNRILLSSLHHVVVSPQDFQTVIEQDNSFNYLEQELAFLSDASKTNLSQLSHPRPSLVNAYVAPGNEIEQTLADIWQQFLGIDRVGIHDNFFELAGDSIIAIQIVAKANQLGLKLTSQQMFLHQTIAELATAAGANANKETKNNSRTREIQLTPFQYRLLNQNQPNENLLSQSLLLEIQQICEPKILEQAVRYVIEYHDVFRLRFIQKESGWQQIEAGTNDLMEYKHINLSQLSKNEQKYAFESAIIELQSNFNLSEGSLVKVAFIELRSQQNSYLIISIHYLLVDSVSWHILLEDLQTAYQLLTQGKTIHLPDKTTSFKRWMQCVQKYDQASEMLQEQDYWLTKAEKPFHNLPVDYSANETTVTNVDRVSITLNKKETQALLKNVNKAYNTQIIDVLLTALVQSFAKWTGEQQLWVDIKDNGRDIIFKDVNDISLSRTVGLFTTCFPAILDITEVSNQGNALIAVKEYLRSIPNKGIGYDILRYITNNSEINSKLQYFPQPQVSFNYLGNFDPTISQSSLFDLTEQSIRLSESSSAKRFYLVEINGIIVQEQLHLNWAYSSAVHRRETIETLAQSFIEATQSLIAHCESLEAEKYTPSDFPRANLNQQNLDKFLAKINRASEKNTQ
ncbi:MAG: beta-ketoacyl synthase N-terminal-like domain-containing protein [Nostoc sp. DedQUE05]|uniref:polyketide synthase n=1 Tax=Nostoc sp. DedQUE05 TaxID=3075391 RepID=UPI002AD49FA2|nr:polyketide synthase [Nostoc sp. DedQUE05]MDZ8091997.1 beta-ketoacyl synthase N-terminal-like domain-containing protein [Nostoc sp. DedQUE05]